MAYMMPRKYYTINRESHIRLVSPLRFDSLYANEINILFIDLWRSFSSVHDVISRWIKNNISNGKVRFYSNLEATIYKLWIWYTKSIHIKLYPANLEIQFVSHYTNKSEDAFSNKI